MRLYLRLAWRNIGRHRRRTMIVVLSIGLGLALMMLYDGFMVGFQDSIYANAVKVLGGNIQVHAQGYRASTTPSPLLALPNDAAVVKAALAQPLVAAASRRINTGGLVSSREGAFAVSIYGVEPEQEAPVSLLAQHVVAGRYLAAGDQDVIFIGRGLADAMGVGVGDRVSLVGRAKLDQMRRRTMAVAGIYDVGLRDIEKRSVYMALGEAQDLYGMAGQSTEVAVSLHALGGEDAVMKALVPANSGYEVSSWETSFPEMQQAINSKNGVMDVFSVIIVVIAGIGILNLLLMAVYERTREIGILAALGLKPGAITLLFMLEGAMLGVAGVIFGVALGLLINRTLGQVGFDYSQFSSMTEYTALISARVYPTLGLDKLPQRALTIIIIAILAAFYPAREAARNEPAQALHFV